MDFIFLPAKIKSVLESLVPGKAPISLLRSSGNLEGSPGEGYVVAYDDKVVLFSKAIGEDDYSKIEASYGDGLGKVSIRKEKFNSFLDMDVCGKSFSIKFSSFEEGDLKPMLDKCGSLREEPSQVVQDATKEEASLEQAHNIDDLPLSPMIAFGAAMMHVAASDNELAKEENEYIHKACFNDNKILGAACEYYKKYSYDELLEIFPELDRQQALCIMANLIDLAMADGVLHSEQQKMVWKFAKAAGLSNSDYEEFREFLLVKNQVTVLGV